MSQQILLLRRKVRGKNVLEEYEEYIHVSDSLSKQLAGLEGVVIETEINLIEPSFTRFKVKTVKDFLKTKMFVLSISPEFFRMIEYKSIIGTKSVRYVLNIGLHSFKSFRLFSHTLFTKRFILSNLVFSRFSVSSHIDLSKKYLLHSKVLFMKHKVSINVDVEKLIDMLELGSDLEYEVFGRIDLEYVFTGGGKGKGIWFGGSKYIGEPIVFITNDDLWYLIAELCKEFYRETRGEFPKPHVIDIEESDDLEKLVNLVELGEKVAKDIIVVRLLGSNVKSCINSPKFKKVMRKIMNELFSQGLGFLILTIDSRSENMSSIIDELESRIMKEYVEFCIPRLIKVKALPIETIPVIEELIRLVYGVKEFTWRSSGRSLRVMGYRIAEVERLYKDLVDNTLRFNKYLYKVRLHKVSDKKESEDHLALKTLVVKNLVENYKVELSDIETEYPIMGKREIIADVYVKSLGWAIEAETLFDTGAAPILKIRDTVLKYKDISGVRKIWVVIRNMPVLIYFRSLLRLLKYLRDEIRDKEIEFYTVNVEKGTLINILDIRRQLLRYLSRASQKPYVMGR